MEKLANMLAKIADFALERDKIMPNTITPDFVEK
jgi:hypothetical protein